MKNLGLFFAVYVDDVEKVREKQNMGRMIEKNLQQKNDFEDPNT